MTDVPPATRPLVAGRVTVVVPTYQHRDYVRATLDSIFAQTRPADEIIVVNDGSPDDTAEVLRPLVEAGRIRYFEQENAGVSVARNRGLWAATGEFVTFVDDDDLVPPDRLEWQVPMLEAEPDVVLVYGEHTLLHPDGRVQPRSGPPLPSGRVERAFLLRNRMISPGQALIRTAALRAIGGFDPSLWGCGDWDAYVRLARVGEFRASSRVALHYRWQGQNASRQHAVRHAKDHLRAVRKLFGWEPIRIARHQYVLGAYYVPNLLRYADEARSQGRHGDALRACGYALLFRPTVLLRPSYIDTALKSALGWYARRRNGDSVSDAEQQHERAPS